ncbi:histidine phosphatase family protein [Mycobacterium sp. NPDC003449]
MTAQETLWIRHGESEWNRAGLMQGQTPWPALTDVGVRQAWRVAERLATGRRPGRILSSDLWRAAQTAGIVGERLGLAVEHTALLRERCWGIHEGRPVAEGYRAESALSDKDALPQGESRADVAARLHRLRPWLAGAGPVVVVTHGDVIREAVALWSPRPSIHPPENGCVVGLLLTGT